MMSLGSAYRIMLLQSSFFSKGVRTSQGRCPKEIPGKKNKMLVLSVHFHSTDARQNPKKQKSLPKTHEQKEHLLSSKGIYTNHQFLNHFPYIKGAPKTGRSTLLQYPNCMQALLSGNCVTYLPKFTVPSLPNLQVLFLQFTLIIFCFCNSRLSQYQMEVLRADAMFLN